MKGKKWEKGEKGGKKEKGDRKMGRKLARMVGGKWGEECQKLDGKMGKMG